MKQRIDRPFAIVFGIVIIIGMIGGLFFFKPGPAHHHDEIFDDAVIVKKVVNHDHAHALTTEDKERRGPPEPTLHSRRVAVILTADMCTPEPQNDASPVQGPESTGPEMVEVKGLDGKNLKGPDGKSITEKRSYGVVWKETASLADGLPFNSQKIREAAATEWKRANPNAAVAAEMALEQLKFYYSPGPSCEVGSQIVVEVFSKTVPDTLAAKD